MQLKKLKLSEATFSVIDFETTGTSPQNSRAIEIGIIKIQNLKIVDSFTSLINPGQHIPPFIENLTGITNEDVWDAPTFEQISDKVLKFIDNTILVGHNLSFDHAFLKNECLRNEIKLPELLQICTLKISREIFPELKSKSLGNMLRHFKIRHHDVHRALGDATATAKLLLKLLEHLKFNHDYQFVKDLNSFNIINKTTSGFRLIKKKIAEDLNNLPDSPGVYFFKNNKDKIIYIGKAKSLKKRVKNYFSSSASRKAKKISRKASRLGFNKTNSELSALVLEAELIKIHRPQFNTLLKRYSQNYFIKVNLNHNYPDLKVSSTFDFDGNDYFGPYSNRMTAQNLKEIIDKTFGLRECKDKELKRGKKCYLLDIERCVAPCIYPDKIENYKLELDNTYDFLSGKNQFAINRLLNKMKSLSEQQKYEEAAEVRDTINIILKQLTRSSILAAPINKVNALIKINDSEKIDYLLFIEGKLFLKDYYLKDQDYFDDALDDFFNHTFQLLSEPDSKHLERIKISLSWLVKNRNRVQIYYLNDFNSKEELFKGMS